MSAGAATIAHTNEQGLAPLIDEVGEWRQVQSPTIRTRPTYGDAEFDDANNA